MKKILCSVGILASLVISANTLASTVSLTDGSRSISCVVQGNLTMNNDTVSGSVLPACFDSLGGGSGGGTTYALSVTKSGSGAGTVTSNPAGVNCGATCSYNYAENTSVTLTAAQSSGSTFAGWTGACTGTASTCTLTMSQARTVSAQFDSSSSGGGGNGSDPGGFWEDGNQFVFGFDNLSEVWVPRCIPSYYTNCSYGGSQSTYDSIDANQVWSLRLNHTLDASKTDRYFVKWARSERGEVYNSYDVSLTQTPGDFSSSVDPKCIRTNGYSSSITVVNSSGSSRYCRLEEGKVYYFNVRPSQATPAESAKCGNQYHCRFRLLWNIPSQNNNL